MASTYSRRNRRKQSLKTQVKPRVITGGDIAKKVRARRQNRVKNFFNRRRVNHLYGKGILNTENR